MANALYDKAREGYLAGTRSWSSDDVRVTLVRGYTFSAAHDFLDDVTGAGGTLVATSATLTSKTVTSGVADAADFTYATVGAGAACQCLIGYVHTGTPSTSALVFYIDSATGLPITPNGGDITVTWDAGSNKIFKL